MISTDESTAPKRLVEFYHVKCQSENLTDRWIFDTGAGHHITNNLNIIFDYKKFDSPQKYQIGDKDRHIEAYGTGSVLVNAKLSDGSTHEIELRDVHYIPAVPPNIFSPQGLMATCGFVVHLHCGRVKVYNKMTDREILSGPVKSGFV